ncbi:MAG: type I-E CRISPR-associated protein Cas5/CasD [Hyphomicrobiales bacterium]|nr:type I-E CRISPR-associated protein Cas5/CasD [Hyphomicrobiales bacterium]
MTRKYLILRLDAPLMSFGDVAVDNYGFTDIWPAASMLTGLIGNALGYDRTEGEKLNRLQQRLDFACRLDRPGRPVKDFQTAALNKDDQGWTTRGAPEGRAGGPGTYLGKHIRYRDFIADAVVVVALTLRQQEEVPAIEDVSAAFLTPARPLFIGRKPCLPSRPVHAGERVEAPDALSAVCAAARDQFADLNDKPRITWRGESVNAPGRKRDRRVYGERNWVGGVHGGEQLWREAEFRWPEGTR